MHSVLVLAGTAEARILSATLRDDPSIEVTVSLAGLTRNPGIRAAAMRVGGFGGAAGLRDWLRAHGTAAVIDATHPFAARMPMNACAACAAAGVPRLRLLRPEWPVRSEWTVVPDLRAAAAALPAAARVFLTTGRDVAPFAARTDCRFWVRTIEPVPLPAHMRPVIGRPPVASCDELRLIRSMAPTHIVSKNAGGEAAKLDIARALGIQVLMVERPPAPPGPVAGAPAEALDWLRATLDSPAGLPER